EYGLEQLVAAGEADELCSRHADFFLRLADLIPGQPLEPPSPGWLDRVGGELANLRAALEWAIRQGDVGRVAGLSCVLGRLWFIRNQFAEGRRLLAQALALPLPPGPGRAAGLDWLGRMAFEQGDFQEARVLLQEALELFEREDDRKPVAVVLIHLGT